MKHLSIALIATLTLCFLPIHLNAQTTHDDGVAAFNRGDYQNARRIALPIAERGYAPAQLLLAMMYENGSGVSASAPDAFRWYHKAATQGDIVGITKIGIMYLEGRGTAQDFANASEWLRKSAEKNHYVGMLKLASAILDGKIADDNYALAVKLLYRAADESVFSAVSLTWYGMNDEVGHETAQFRLGQLYALGQGVAVNNGLAHMWFNLAGAADRRGGREARMERDKLAKMMSQEQIAEAQRMAREWKPFQRY